MNISDWKVMLASLNQGSCVALIGPGLSTTVEDGEPQNVATTLSRQLAAELKEIESEKSVDVQDPDKLSLVAQCYSDCFSAEVLRDEVASFYNRYQAKIDAHSAEDRVFESLAALPLSLFISARHDGVLEHFLRARGKKPVEKSYDFSGDQQRSVGELGSIESPLVYHILGSTRDPRSMALTESDLLDLLENIISGNPALPNDLRNTFNQKSFLFLGCGLHTYYIRILLHALGLNESGKPSFAPEAPSTHNNNSEFNTSVWFYEVGYKALRLLDMEERSFIEELGKRWQEKHPEGAAFRPVPSSDEVYDDAEQPEVFISYVSEDVEDAQQLAQALTSNGIQPWLDKRRLRGGDRWDLALDKAIGAVDFFIVLLSKHLTDHVQTYVHKEISKALERQAMFGAGVKFIFPMRIDSEAPRLAALDHAKIQSSDLINLDIDIAELASDVKKQFAKIQRR